MQYSVPFKSILAAAMLAGTVSVLTGCGGDEQAGNEADEVAASPQMIDREAPGERAQPKPEPSPDEDFRVVPEVTSQSDEEGSGLETMIDASSKQAYAESMRWIAEDVSREQLNELEQSIRFVHMYDSSVFGSEKRLLEYIDGKTGREIIERATELRKKHKWQ
jgi:hypothetical protein